MDESRPLVHQVSNESRASLAESLSEFFDAQEVLLSASSSENEVRVRPKPYSSADEVIYHSDLSFTQNQTVTQISNKLHKNHYC